MLVVEIFIQLHSLVSLLQKSKKTNSYKKRSNDTFIITKIFYNNNNIIFKSIVSVHDLFVLNLSVLYKVLLRFKFTISLLTKFIEGLYRESNGTHCSFYFFSFYFYFSSLGCKRVSLIL